MGKNHKIRYGIIASVLAVMMILASCSSKTTTASSTGSASSAVASASSAATSQAAEDNKITERLFIGGGSAGGTGGLAASAWVERIKQDYPGVQIDMVTGGTNPNILKLEAGEFNAILATTSFMAKAHYGTPFVPELTEPVPQLLAVTNLWDQYFTFAVRADFPAETIDEVIRNKMKINLVPGGPKGHTGTVSFEEYLTVVYGLTYKDMEDWGCKIIYAEYADACQMMQDGQLDMFAPLTAAPAGAIMELATSTSLKFLTIEQESIDKMKPHGYVEAMMSKDFYKGMTEDVKTLSLPYGIGVDANLSEDTVYKITKAICEGEQYMKDAVSAMRYFDPQKAATEMGFPLHPGAEKYFKEMGWI